MPYLSRIILYPIKSLDGVSVTKAKVLESGALQLDCAKRSAKCDREFAIFDAQGTLVNGKCNPKIHLLRTSFDTDLQTVSLQVQGSQTSEVFKIDEQLKDLEAWLAQFFGFAVSLEQNNISGFPDDTFASGPTVISAETLETVAAWFTGLSVDETRSRFRANLEFSDVPAFWEDRLFGKEGETVHFQVGDVLFTGINPCQRCVVPTRDSMTGDIYPEFTNIFTEQRQKTLPEWVEYSRFNHFFKLSVNTIIPRTEAGKILQVGDEVKIII